MASKIFNALLEEKIKWFVSAYESTSNHLFYDEKERRLRHTGEYGAYREILVREFLSFFTPQRLDIHNGFIITSMDSVSTQCDVIIFDSKSTPLIENGERQRFFPIETVCAVGEVKSSMSKDQLKKAINKLAKVKSLREQIQAPTIIRRERTGPFDPKRYAYDQVPSFLICEKFDFNFSTLADEIGGLYASDVAPRHRHNLILSLKDGLLAYFDSKNHTIMFPEMSGRVQKDRTLSPTERHKNRMVIPTEQSLDSHIKIFCSYMFMLSSSTTILYPEITNYIYSEQCEFMNES